MRFYTKAEAAEVLRVSPFAIAQYIKNGDLVASKPAGKILIDERDLEAFVDAGRIIVGPLGSPGSLR
jgi:excisionase family DNA binding protein